MSTRDVVRLLQKRKVLEALDLVQKGVVPLDQFVRAAETVDPEYWDRVRFIFEAGFTPNQSTS